MKQCFAQKLRCLYLGCPRAFRVLPEPLFTQVLLTWLDETAVRRRGLGCRADLLAASARGVWSNGLVGTSDESHAGNERSISLMLKCLITSCALHMLLLLKLPKRRFLHESITP